MTEYTLHTFINDLKQEDNNTGQARLEDFHHAGDGPDGPDGPLWMLPADCGNRRAEVVVSLLRTGPVEMGDNIRPMLMLPVKTLPLPAYKKIERENTKSILELLYTLN